MFSWQRWLVNPTGQRHSNPLIKSKHCLPSTHWTEKHSSMLFSQYIPSNPEMQISILNWFEHGFKWFWIYLVDIRNRNLIEVVLWCNWRHFYTANWHNRRILVRNDVPWIQPDKRKCNWPLDRHMFRYSGTNPVNNRFDSPRNVRLNISRGGKISNILSK